jgi:hypothetical protein
VKLEMAVSNAMEVAMVGGGCANQSCDRKKAAFIRPGKTIHVTRIAESDLLLRAVAMDSSCLQKPEELYTC